MFLPLLSTNLKRRWDFYCARLKVTPYWKSIGGQNGIGNLTILHTTPIFFMYIEYSSDDNLRLKATPTFNFIYIYLFYSKHVITVRNRILAFIDFTGILGRFFGEREKNVFSTNEILQTRIFFYESMQNKNTCFR